MHIRQGTVQSDRACVEKAESMGFRIVRVCINASYDPALMFKHYIKLENLSNLAHDLGKVIAKTLSKSIKAMTV